MKFGIIGGSGLYEIDSLENIQTEIVETPFGSPSDSFITGTYNDTDLVFLPRHGKGHKLLPGELNHKANIFAMKKLGVTHIISISAVGSLKEELAPKDVVLVDQYFDRTKKGLEHTFFGNGLVAHVALAHPVCNNLKNLAYKATQTSIANLSTSEYTPKVHLNGTYINMEGPAFSTKAESMIYKSWGLDVIGMTNMAEAKLAREAEMCYCTVAMVTDYDCWHPDHDHVTVEMIIENLHANTALAKNIIKSIIDIKESLATTCSCNDALKYSLITDPDAIPVKTKQTLQPIIGKYYPV
jgi:5'-methylthioadenosine phosphorylase